MKALHILPALLASYIFSSPVLVSAQQAPEPAAVETPKESTVEPLTLPPVEKFVLPNGLTIMVLENHQVPHAAFRLLFKTGGIQDPEGKEGVARLATTLLTYGTQARTETEINEQVDFLGASLSAYAGRSNMQVYGDVTTVKKSNLKTFFDLLAEVALKPAYPQDALDRLRTRMIGGLQASRDDNSTLASRAMQLHLFEGHPFGRPVGGQPATLKAIQREDIEAFHSTYFIPEHAVLGVSGDVDANEIRQWAEEAFGGAEWGSASGQRICIPKEGASSTCEAFQWKGARIPNKRLTLPKAKEESGKTGIEVIVVDRDDPSLNQVQWRLGHQGVITKTSEDWFDWRLGTHLLGGDFTARLNQVLRVREGLTYGARLQVEHGKEVPGKVLVSTYVKPKDLRRAIELAFEELEKAQSEPIKPEEIANFRAKIVESLPFRFETSGDTLAEHINLIASDMDAAFLESYPVRLDQVTAASAQAALNRGLRTTGLMLVVVANRSIVDELQPLIDARGGSIKVISVDSLFIE